MDLKPTWPRFSEVLRCLQFCRAVHQLPMEIVHIIADTYHHLTRPYLDCHGNRLEISIDRVQIHAYRWLDATWTAQTTPTINRWLNYHEWTKSHRIRVINERMCGILCGEDITMAWTKSGRYMYGKGSTGHLGLGDYEDHSCPVFRPTKYPIIAAGCSPGYVVTIECNYASDSLANATTGARGAEIARGATRVVYWGWNLYSPGEGCAFHTPRVAEHIKNPISLICGNRFALILDASNGGRVYRADVSSSVDRNLSISGFMRLELSGISRMYAHGNNYVARAGPQMFLVDRPTITEVHIAGATIVGSTFNCLDDANASNSFDLALTATNIRGRFISNHGDNPRIILTTRGIYAYWKSVFKTGPLAGMLEELYSY